MDKYECLGTIGEGTYGVVLKCRHKVTGQIVAIKKFKESDDDEQVKKTALREIRILKQLKHENIVSLLEVFRMKDKLYLVFEFVEKTILEEIERHPDGLDPKTLKQLMWQLVRAITFCHQHNIIHRDIKPENLLVSRNGVLKLCDFGFARPLAGVGAKYTEYVSTRWYRAPELLVGDVSYGKAVDVWSIGCMFAEIATGLPLFPGDSDIDQLYHIMRCLGGITTRHHELFRKNELYTGVNLPQVYEVEPLELRFPTMDKVALDFMLQTIVDEPLDRWTCAELLKHPFFGHAHEAFERELHEAIARDVSDTAAVRKKRARQPSRGKLVAGSTPVFLVPSFTFSDVVSKVANAETGHSLEPCSKSNKEKNKLTVESNGHAVSRKTSPGLETDAYHLPTLHSIGTSSSSLSHIANSTALAVNGMPFGDTGTSTGQISPLLHQNKKLTVPPRHLEATTSGLSVPMEHRTFIGVHDKGRGSITSHGGRIAGDRGIAVHPYTNPLSCMKSLYGVEQPLQRENGKKSGIHAAVSSQLSSKDMHAAKKTAKDVQYAYGHDTGWSGMKNGVAFNTGSNLMSRATPPQLRLYAPLRTSYHSLRAPTILPNHCALVQRKK